MNLQQLNNNIPFKAYVLYVKRIVEMEDYKYVGSSVFDYGGDGRNISFYYEKGERDLLIMLFEGSEDIYIEVKDGKPKARNTYEQVFTSPQELKKSNFLK